MRFIKWLWSIMGAFTLAGDKSMPRSALQMGFCISFPQGVVLNVVVKKPYIIVFSYRYPYVAVFVLVVKRLFLTMYEK